MNYPALSVGALGEGCCPTTVGSHLNSLEAIYLSAVAGSLLAIFR
ncbi:MAG: hypothetical protein ACE5R6_02335 [Candidatus Heimdallarchaeota archaeon]